MSDERQFSNEWYRAVAATIDQQQKEIERLRALLGTYGACQEDCASREEHATWVRQKRCNCGWDGVKQAAQSAGVGK